MDPAVQSLGVRMSGRWASLSRTKFWSEFIQRGASLCPISISCFKHIDPKVRSLLEVSRWSLLLIKARAEMPGFPHKSSFKHTLVHARACTYTPTHAHTPTHKHTLSSFCSGPNRSGRVWYKEVLRIVPLALRSGPGGRPTVCSGKFGEVSPPRHSQLQHLFGPPFGARSK